MIKIIIFILLTVSLTLGQSFDAVSLGLAGNYSAMSRGVNAIPWNPANLCLPRGNTFELIIFSFNTGIMNSSFSLNEYNRYFTAEGHNDYWTKKDKEEILELVSDGINLNLGFGSNFLGCAYNNFGFAAQVIGQSDVQFTENKKLIEIALHGENIDTDYEYYDPSLLKAGAYSAIKLSFGYGYPLKIKKYLPNFSKLAVGLNLNYYMGAAVAQTLESEALIRRTKIDDDNDVLEYNARFKLRTSIPESGFLAGNGFGLDLGATAKYDKNWQFSLSFTNLFASIKWSDNTEKTVLIERDSTKLSDLFDDKKEDTSVSEDTTYSIGSFSTSLPVDMRLSVSYNMRKDLTLIAEWEQGLNEQFGNSLTPRIGVGAEYFIWNWLPFRIGIAAGGKEGFLFGLGFGLHFSNFALDYSYAMSDGLWPTYATGIFSALSMKIMF